MKATHVGVAKLPDGDRPPRVTSSAAMKATHVGVAKPCSWTPIVPPLGWELAVAAIKATHVGVAKRSARQRRRHAPCDSKSKPQ